jgi:general secretion pathway protein G
MPPLSRHPSKGFTLIELLLVITIMAILGGIIFLALNPTKQLGLARDRQRHNDLNSLVNALYQYQIDHNQFPPGIPTGTARDICRDTAASCNNGINLAVLSQNGQYLVAIPADPHAPATGTGTSYFLLQQNGRLTATAPLAEQTEGGVSVQK